MPDKRKHRGPNPRDLKDFDRRWWPALQAATADLSWLLSRDYPEVAAVKLVGDRYGLRRRQRLAVRRSACSDQALDARNQRRVDRSSMNGQPLQVDGFNVLLSVEAALGGGVIIEGRDGCYRDMASVHGTFRLVRETDPALEKIGQLVESLGVESTEWWLDEPVSNSGRLAERIRDIAAENDWNWSAELVASPDRVLKSTAAVVASADSVILDEGPHWCPLARWIIEDSIRPVHVVPMIEPN